MCIYGGGTARPAAPTAPARAGSAGPPQGQPAWSDALIDGLPSGISIIDRDFRIQRVNQYLATWLKREPAEMVGQQCYRLLHARETPCTDCPSAISFRTGEPATTVHAGLDAEGGATHAEIVSLPIRDASGQVVLALESVRDVSERERHLAQLAEVVEHLRASEEQLRRRNEELELLNGLLVRTGYTMGLDAVLTTMLAGALRMAGGAASGAIYLLDASGRRLQPRASQGQEGPFLPCAQSVRLGQCSCAEAALGGRVVVTTSGADGACRAAAAPGEAHTSVAVPLASSDHVLGALVIHLQAGRALPQGRERLFELLGRQMGIAIENAQLFQRTDAQLHGKLAELTRALAAVEQERARAQASERAKEELVTMVSHDLRSPLSVILSDASDHGRTCQDEGCRESRQSIRRSVRRASTMLSEVVDSARLEAGRLDLRHDPLDLVPLVRELVESDFPASERGRLRLEVALEAAPVVGDRSWLERALANVVGNALKFAPADTPVTLRLARAGAEVRVEVVDEGPGIPADELPLIFQRHFRASNAQWTGGSGLGLYITRLVVETLGGQVAVQSELGRGSAIRLTLPLR